jgi:hypothetical protein
MLAVVDRNSRRLVFPLRTQFSASISKLVSEIPVLQHETCQIVTQPCPAGIIKTDRALTSQSAGQAN